MAQVNGHHAQESCPFIGDSEKENNKSVKPNLRVKVPQPMRLKNHLAQEENFDTLHSRFDELTSFNTKCSEKVCQASIMDIPGRGDTPRSAEEVYQDAEIFLKEYYTSIRRENSEAFAERLKAVRAELKEKGTYQLKTSELAFGAKQAWRNASRCIGRIQWKKLQFLENSEAFAERLKAVRAELKEKGTYQLKTSELAFGAKQAWRNASRCIGRIQWKKLQNIEERLLVI
nr:unnamed protein product [Amyelois transitella]